MPIFMGPVFDPLEHRVRNWAEVPGERGFPGLDAYGWGLHPTGMIDCINLPNCKFFDGSIRNWAKLWNSEAMAEGDLCAYEDTTQGHKLFLRTIIRRVMLNPIDPAFCPNPELWDVKVDLEGSVPNGAIGRLVPRNIATKESEDQRFSKFTERSGPWSAKVGISTWLKNNHQSR